jgi:hypothetical protein
MDSAEKITAATWLKVAGNEALMSGRFKLATNKYEKALRYVEDRAVALAVFSTSGRRSVHPR